MRMRLSSLLTSRRGEDKVPSAAGAAILVLLIALLIVLYVLFLPPAERCSLLDTCDQVSLPGTPTAPGTPSGLQAVIYTAAPGAIEDRGPQIYALPSFRVQTSTSGNLLAERSGLTLEHSVFHNEEAQMSFALPDASDNVYLSFTALSSEGNLRIDLNDERIYDAPLSTRQPSPISLPASLLENTNELVFSVSGVGFSLWNTNEIRLSNVRVTGDVTSFAQASQSGQFVLAELDDVKRVQLRFAPDCNFGTVGRLLVRLNSNIIYSGLPECGTPLSFDLAQSRLREGENTVQFETSAGQYFLDQVEVVVDREDQEYLHSFFIPQELLSRAIAENRPISLELSFDAPGAEGRMLMNGRDLAYRTHRTQFSGSIMNYIQVGQNEIELVSSTVPIRQLRVLYG